MNLGMNKDLKVNLDLLNCKVMYFNKIISTIYFNTEKKVVYTKTKDALVMKCQAIKFKLVPAK